MLQTIHYSLENYYIQLFSLNILATDHQIKLGFSPLGSEFKIGIGEYSNPAFKKSDLLLKLQYSGINSFRDVTRN